MSGSSISWDICKSAPRPRQITMPASHRSVFYRLDALPATQLTASKYYFQALWRTRGYPVKTQHSILSGRGRRWWCGLQLSDQVPCQARQRTTRPLYEHPLQTNLRQCHHQQSQLCKQSRILACDNSALHKITKLDLSYKHLLYKVVRLSKLTQTLVLHATVFMYQCMTVLMNLCVMVNFLRAISWQQNAVQYSWKVPHCYLHSAEVKIKKGNAKSCC